MADPESSDVLANLPTGRPARRSSRRTGEPGGSGATASAATATPKAPAKRAAAAKPAAKAPAKRATPAKASAAKTPAKTAAAKSTATAKAKPAASKAAPATKTKAAAKPATKSTPAAKAPAAKAKAAAAKTTSTPAAKADAPKTAAKAPARAAQPRRPRIATPTEGRRADFSAGSATHRARKVTTNRPWLPSSGFALPDSKERPAIGMALEGLAAALGDVARLSFGIAQSITARGGKRDELEPSESETPEPTKS